MDVESKIGNASFKLNDTNKIMKKVSTVITFCAIAALPIGAVVAGTLSSCKSAANEVTAADEEAKTVNLKITGMN